MDRESQMVVIEYDETGWPSVWCDPEIVDIVRSLNKGGVKTVASCSGHGFRPGNIALVDGRELIIARDYAEARKIEKLFPVNANGEPMKKQTPLCEAKAILRSRGFRITGNQNPHGSYRVWNAKEGMDYRVSADKMIAMAAVLKDHNA